MSKRSETEHPAVPPENVRIVRADGTEIPLDVRYLGVVDGEDGMPLHQWEAISEYLPQVPDDHIRMDTLPARTTVSLTFRGPDGR